MLVSNHWIQYASEKLEKLGYKDVLFLNEKEPTHWLDSHTYGVFRANDTMNNDKVLFIHMNLSILKVQFVRYSN